MSGAGVIVSAPPSHATRAVVDRVRDAVAPGRLVVSATKGIETDTLALMSEVFAERLPEARFAALSGPSFALEVCQGQPTAVVAAARDEASALRRRSSSSRRRRFRVYSGRDVVGVELAGALKNVIAIAAGILEGLGLGHNPRAALITRGLAEITRLGVAHGRGPAHLRRARRHGRPGAHDHREPQPEPRARRGAGAGADARAVPGGAPERGRRRQHVAVPARRWARAWAWSCRSSQKVCEVLFSGKPARDAVAELMGRELKAEQWR